MEPSSSRPTGVTVVAWGGIILGMLMAFSGAMGALVSLMIPNMPQSRGSAFPAPIKFVFRHFSLFAMLQVMLAAVLVAAGRALLHLRRWGALVIQGVATLGILYLLAFTVMFVAQLTPMFSSSTPGPQSAAMVGIIAGGAVFNALFWGTPLVLVIYHLRTKRVQAILV